ncbi:DUF6624 domain-containing protein [Chryseobacterium shigense]|uniref:Uncharacterized protein n=1 Tax=Chryseobacterium shigense TaxID=297244 RepID=A0A841N077_9FLAO|nr:DUF6624 domain-containing protein [Chryseobacterium shigense]MBB6369807.1 hypothetical protein [Chryseobacterium shigense]
MKKLFFLLFFILYTMNFSQKFEYFDYIEKAENLYHQKKYESSGKYFDKAYEIMNEKIIQKDLYNAACTWSMAGNLNKSFFYLNHIIENKMLQGWDDPVEFYKNLDNDSDLNNLKKDARWNTFMDTAYNNQQSYLKNINNPIAEKIKLIGEKDQEIRLRLDSIRKRDGLNTSDEKELMKQIEKQDSINILEVEKIINDYGWLGPHKIGYKNNQYLFLVIQHADLGIQKKYLPVLRQAVEDKQALPKDLAYLQDRIKRKEGLPQIYGTQVYIDKEASKYFLYPAIDIANIDQRRALVGLEPLSGYLKNSFNIKWDINEYLDKAPDLEKKLLKK